MMTNDCRQMGVSKFGNWALIDNSCVQLPLHPKMLTLLTVTMAAEAKSVRPSYFLLGRTPSL